MEQKKYHSIVRYGHRTTTNVLNKGDYIVIQEKIDGANASFAVVDGELKCWSRNTLLDGSNTLGGFYDWVHNNINKDTLLDGVLYFGEWLTPHKVVYAEEYKKQFFLYDIYNTHLEEYVSFSMVEDEHKRLGLNLVPVFFKGEFESYEQISQYIGRTELGGTIKGEPSGEGIVVKNVSYKDNFGKQMFVKLVVDGFAEFVRQKLPKDPKAMSKTRQLVADCLTQARVDKHLFKMVDEGFLVEDYGIEEMGSILKHLNGVITEDIIKEEMQDFEYEVKQVRKDVGAVLPLIVKQIIKDK